jgi:hypothetical protein
VSDVEQKTKKNKLDLLHLVGILFMLFHRHQIAAVSVPLQAFHHINILLANYQL